MRSLRILFFFFSSRRRHTRFDCDWSSDVCSSDLKAARDFRLGLESLIAQGKADGTVKPGAAEVWAAVWLSIVSLAVDRVSAKEWPETHAGVTLALDGAWDAIAETRRLGA